MQTFRPPVTLGALLVLGAALGCVPPAALGQSSACLTADPSGITFIGNLRAYYADPRIDSLRWKAANFPFATDTAIRLVTDNKTCTSAVKAFQSSKSAHQYSWCGYAGLRRQSRLDRLRGHVSPGNRARRVVHPFLVYPEVGTQTTNRSLGGSLLVVPCTRNSGTARLVRPTVEEPTGERWTPS
jgi:hypothetical protein